MNTVLNRYDENALPVWRYFEMDFRPRADQRKREREEDDSGPSVDFYSRRMVGSQLGRLTATLRAELTTFTGMREAFRDEASCARLAMCQVKGTECEARALATSLLLIGHGAE